MALAQTEQLVIGGLDVNDYVTWYITDEPTFAFTPARKKVNWSGGGLADGEALVGNEDHYSNADLVFGAATFPQPDKDTALSVLSGLTNVLQEARRTAGGLPMVWTPSGSSVPLTWYVMEAEWDALNLTRSGGWFDNAPSGSVHLSLRPFGYAQEQSLPLGYTDPFSRNTWTGGPWQFDVSGGLSWFGVLFTTNTANKRMYLPFTTADSVTAMRVRTSTTLTSMDVGIQTRRTALGTYLKGTLTASTLKLSKVTGGSEVDLVTPASFTPATSTFYWLVFSVVGDDLTLSLYADGLNPLSTTGATPLASLSYTLGGGDSAFSGVRGNPGMFLTPGSAGAIQVSMFQVRGMQDLLSADPLVTFELRDVPGHVSADARLVVQEEAGISRSHFEHGRECRDYDPTIAPPLHLESSATGDLTVTGFAGIRDTGAAGVTRITATGLATTLPLTVCGTVSLPHAGIFKVRLRVSGDVGVRCRWAWRVGDGQYRRTPYVALPETADSGGWYELEIPSPMVIPQAAIGVQSWDGRVEAYSPGKSNGTIHLDYIELIPMEGYGIASAPIQAVTPTVYSALDEFDYPSPDAVLTGKIATPGGTWTVLPAGGFSAADGDDFVVNTTAHRATRAAMSDVSLTQGRLVSLGTATYAGIQAQADVSTDAQKLDLSAGGELRIGIFVRGNTMGDWLAVILKPDPADLFGTGSNSPKKDSTSIYLAVYKRLAGANPPVLLAQKLLGTSGWDRTRTLQLAVDTSGTWAAYSWPAGNTQPSAPTLSGMDLDFVTGTLSSGRVGLFDVCTLTTPVVTRRFDNVQAFAGTQDAVLWANRSLEIRSDRAEREEKTPPAGGSRYGREQRYRGSWFTVPSAGANGHVTRVAAKLRTLNVDEGLPDGGPAAFSIAAFGKPRYLTPKGD